MTKTKEDVEHKKAVLAALDRIATALEHDTSPRSWASIYCCAAKRFNRNTPDVELTRFAHTTYLMRLRGKFGDSAETFPIISRYTPGMLQTDITMHLGSEIDFRAKDVTIRTVLARNIILALEDEGLWD
jgi:hypothetical protein